MSKKTKEQEQKEQDIVLTHRYQNRITVVRFGKECLDADNYTAALSRFIEYLEILKDVKHLESYFQLSPKQFEQKSDLTELLLISNVFFEMSRIYDVAPKFKDELQKCLNQYIQFTVNQPFQHANSEQLRKHIKNGKLRNPELFRYAYNQIQTESKKCYVATLCFGDSHPVTNDLRQFKKVLCTTRLGLYGVDFYYRLSTKLVQICEYNRLTKLVSLSLLKPIILLVSKTLVPLIMKTCRSSRNLS